MRRIVVPLLLLSLVGACSQISSSRLNPTNWLRAQEGPPSLIPEEKHDTRHYKTRIRRNANLSNRGFEIGPHIGRENFGGDRLCHPRRGRECRV